MLLSDQSCCGAEGATGTKVAKAIKSFTVRIHASVPDLLSSIRKGMHRWRIPERDVSLELSSRP